MTRLGRLAAGFAPAFALLGLAPALHAAPNRAKELAVEVLDVAAGRAYIAPGESAGLRVGDSVRFGAKRYKVSAANGSTAVIELTNQALRRGARGTAQVNETQAQGPRRLDKPHALAAFRGQWSNAKLPALAQHPKPVPLGPMLQTGGTRVALGLSASGSVPLASPGSNWERTELRARVRSEPIHDLPLRLDADVALQLWFARDAGMAGSRASRPLVRVRALELAYGHDNALLAAAGRLRYAANASGMLDGAKVQTPLFGGLTLAAFGGFVPDPLSGKPSSDASRFGAELGWENLQLALRPRAALSAQGSRFDGALDERRLNAVVDVFPGRSHAGAYASLSMFDRDNPWNASTQELSAAGANVTARFGEFEAGLRLDMQRPERSRWLASFLPQGWFCTRTASSVASTQDSCRAGDARFLAQGDVGLHKPNLALTVGATASRTAHIDADQLGGFATASFLRVVRAVHIDSALMAQTGSLLHSAAVSIGAGSLLVDDQLDVSLHYRPALTRYTADTGAFVEHTLGANLLLLLGDSTDISFAADAIAGRDLRVLLVQSALNWRPDAF